jgi:hypothetical protein
MASFSGERSFAMTSNFSEIDLAGSAVKAKVGAHVDLAATTFVA